MLRWNLSHKYNWIFIKWPKYFPRLNELKQRYGVVVKWKCLPLYLPYAMEIHPLSVDSSHKGQYCGSLMFSLLLAWRSCWTNSWNARLKTHQLSYNDTVINSPSYLFPCSFVSARMLAYSIMSTVVTALCDHTVSPEQAVGWSPNCRDIKVYI